MVIYYLLHYNKFYKIILEINHADILEGIKVYSVYIPIITAQKVEVLIITKVN